METKEDIIAVGLLEKAIAPEIYSGEELAQYLSDIERDVRFACEAGEEYYLVCSGGVSGFFSLYNEGTTVTVNKVGILPEMRRKGLFRRCLDFILSTYDPQMIKIRAAGNCPAFDALGFCLRDGYYEKRFD